MYLFYILCIYIISSNSTSSIYDSSIVINCYLLLIKILFYFYYINSIINYYKEFSILNISLINHSLKSISIVFSLLINSFNSFKSIPIFSIFTVDINSI